MFKFSILETTGLFCILYLLIKRLFFKVVRDDIALLFDMLFGTLWFGYIARIVAIAIGGKAFIMISFFRRYFYFALIIQDSWLYNILHIALILKKDIFTYINNKHLGYLINYSLKNWSVYSKTVWMKNKISENLLPVCGWGRNTLHHSFHYLLMWRKHRGIEIIISVRLPSLLYSLKGSRYIITLPHPKFVSKKTIRERYKR